MTIYNSGDYIIIKDNCLDYLSERIITIKDFIHQCGNYTIKEDENILINDSEINHEKSLIANQERIVYPNQPKEFFYRLCKNRQFLNIDVVPKIYKFGDDVDRCVYCGDLLIDLGEKYTYRHIVDCFGINSPPKAFRFKGEQIFK